MRCSMTGRPLIDSSEGLWDDGEWICTGSGSLEVGHAGSAGDAPSPFLLLPRMEVEVCKSH
jgi:hypothetical protein